MMATIICPPVGRHSCYEGCGYESSVKLRHNFPTVLPSICDGSALLSLANSKLTEVPPAFVRYVVVVALLLVLV